MASIQVCDSLPDFPPLLSLGETPTLISDSNSNDVAQIELLFARPTANVDLAPIRSEFSGRTLLVTGAAGSIGSELCKQLLALAQSTSRVWITMSQRSAICAWA